MAAAKVQLSAAEEEAVIKARFLTQASVARGEPPFKKLTKRFIALCDETETGSPDSCEAALDLFLRELSGIELQTQKLITVAHANQLEQQRYVQAQQELQARIEQTRADIESRKSELQEARIVAQHNEEYEVLRNAVAQHPARAVTQHEIDRVNKNIEKITAEGKKIAGIMQKRRQQFALLFHVIDELQRAGDEPDDQPDTAAAAHGAEEGADTAQRMDVDN